MRRIRQVLIHCAYVAALIDVGACASEDGLGSSSGVEPGSASNDLLFKKHHLKKKKKHHWDDCADDAGVTDDAGTPRMCQTVSLHVDSFKHREDSQKSDGTIKVEIPESLDASYWGKRVEAELTFEQGGKRVTCSYVARSHKGVTQAQSLELERCDNGAKAGDSVSIDSATLSLDCSTWAWAKVSVDLHETEPCGDEPPPATCDESKLDDKNPCTRDFCDDKGVAQHEPLARGSSCADDNVCNGDETCDDAGKCQPGNGPAAPPADQCHTAVCDPQGGWKVIAKAAGTSCNDNNQCTLNETCNTAGECTSATLKDCSDGNMCNGEELCDPTNGCLAGDPPNANDGNPCTVDACDPATGPTHTPQSFDDNDKCTVDSCGPLSGETHTLIDFNDNNPCTADSCDPATGPTHTPAANIDDHNECTADMCDPATGLTMHLPTNVDQKCSVGDNLDRACSVFGTCDVILQ